MITDDILFNGSLNHPLFSPNQLLTNKHLNDTRDFLEGQPRLTRTNLIGVGIVCGFRPQWDDENKVLRISRGCGVTSEGHLISEDDMELSQYGEAVLPDVDQAHITGDFSPVYELFESGADQEAIKERVVNEVIRPLDEPLVDGGTVIAEQIPDMIPVLFLDVRDRDLDVCENDCDEAGGRRFFNLRILLFSEEQVERLLRRGYELEDDVNLDHHFNARFLLPDIDIQRFGYVEGAESGEAGDLEFPRVDLTLIDGQQVFLQRYEEICNTLIEPIATAYVQAAEFYKLLSQNPDVPPLFSPDSADELETKLIEMLDAYNAVPPETGATGGEELPMQPKGIQYVYDYFKDLVLAYREFRDAVWDLMDDCVPPPNRFPLHLALGKVRPAPGCKPSYLRTHFQQPPIYNGNARRKKEVAFLFEKMKRLLTTFDLQEPRDIRIIPSAGPLVPLSHQAIPFYYKYEELKPVWNFDLTRKCRQNQNRSYHAVDSEPPMGQVLFQSIDQSPFLRIEGHLGLDFNAALDELNRQKQQYNLPFDVIALKLGIEPDEENIQYDFYFQDLETVFVKLRNDLSCVLEEKLYTGDLPDDVENAINTLLDILSTGTGDSLNDLARFDEAYDERNFESLYRTVFPESSNYPEDCSLEAFQAVLGAYRSRRDAVMERLLFHCFAKEHPGMEHLAGVPKGGTFILVYINVGEAKGELNPPEEDEEPTVTVATQARSIGLLEEVKEKVRKTQEDALRMRNLYKQEIMRGFEVLEQSGVVGGEQLERLRDYVQDLIEERSTPVIADFCLPYLCCSGEPSLNFVVQRRAPILLLDPSEFCVNDSEEYEFIVFPQGGTLTGRGTLQRGSAYLFVPGNIVDDPDDLTATEIVEVVYTDPGGGVSRFNITVHPVPSAAFNLEEGFTFCEDDDPIDLSPEVPGGAFTVSVDGVETGMEELRIVDENYMFHPARVPLEEGPAAQVTVRYEVSEFECDNFLEKTVTVEPRLNTAFRIIQGEVEVEAVCAFDGPVLLDPVVEGGEFTVVVAETNEPLDLMTGGVQFDPAVLNPGLDQEIALRISYDLSGLSRCGGISPAKPLIVRGQPNTAFDILLDGQQVSDICVDGPVLDLKPANKTGDFSATANDNPLEGAIINNNQFDPSAAAGALETSDNVAVTVVHRIEEAGECSNETPRTINVWAVPQPDFQARFQRNENGLLELAISGITPDNGQQYRWRINPGPEGEPAELETSSADFRITYREVIPEAPVEVQLFVTRFGCIGQSEPKTVLNIDQLQLIAVLGQNEYAVVAAPIENEGKYPIEAFQEREALLNISALTLPPVVGSVFFQFRGPSFGRGFTVNDPVTIAGNQAYLMIPPLGANPGVQPELGNYEVTATPYSEADRKGRSGPEVSLTFEIVSESRGIEGGDVAPDDFAVFNRRAASHRSALEDLGGDASLARTKAYGMADSFLAFMGPQGALDERFEEAAKGLIANMKRSGGERQEQYAQVMTVLLHNYLDKQVATGPGEVPKETRERLSDILADAKEAGLDIAAVRKEWGSRELKNATQGKAVDKFIRLLKKAE